MPFISATQIHDGRSFLPIGSIIELNEDGVIIAIHQPGTIPVEQIIHYEGIICPGFVNAHCHTELSHMLGVIEEDNGLVRFLQAVVQQRNKYSEHDKQSALLKAFTEMKNQGIVALGDIANTSDSFQARMQAGMHVHTFVESLGFTQSRAEECFAWAKKIYDVFAAQTSNKYQLSQSIVPHAPYSVSDQLFALIDQFEPHSLLSIHNEETPDELEYFVQKTGKMKELYDTLGINDDFFQASGKTSLQTYLPYLSDPHPLLLVHNTCITPEDIEVLKYTPHKVSLCICANANWYIERKLPPLDLFVASGLNICLGTDSLCSNHQLSMMAEFQRIQDHFPEIQMEQLIQWATYNGALALQLDSVIGQIAAGKKPGIVHIDRYRNSQLLYEA
jgi:cytosine/adenosine deaminase-related metal-dependent hydrolase